MPIFYIFSPLLKHEKYIQRCIEIAQNGIGATRPNPSVGAVIVLNEIIIGEGYTSAYGKNHAEVNAINSVKDTSVLREATLYVTLEPCAHYGKTPPCADLIVKHQIKNVVIGCIDTNSLVGGKGIDHLKKAGCTVIVGVLEKECLAHHKRFFMVQNKKRPYIILKWAQTKKGFISPVCRFEDANSNNVKKEEAKPVWISNQYAQQLVHKWRSEEHAILVGTTTVIADNPQLNVRSWSGNDPIRIVLDRSLRIPLNFKVYDGSVKTLFFTERRTKNSASTSEDSPVEYSEKRSPYQEPTFVYIDFSENIAQQICAILQEHQIQSIIIEGGAQTLQTFIDANLWDEARIFVGATEFEKGMKAPIISGKLVEELAIKNDCLKILLPE